MQERQMSFDPRPQETASGNGSQNSQAAGEGTRRPDLYVIRIPDEKERVRAMGALLDVNEPWVSTVGNLYGLNGRHMKALQARGIAFEWVSKPPAHA
jgi:hypothetical protein